MIFIVDTNVAVVANGKSEQASAECVLECVERLNAIMENERIALDDKYLIIKEYQDNLRQEGQPGVGDRFLRWILLNQATGRVDFTVIQPAQIDLADEVVPSFLEFPLDARLHKFDVSDHKFVAVAKAHPENPPIFNAVDTDWWHFQDALDENGVTVAFLCPNDIRRFL